MSILRHLTFLVLANACLPAIAETVPKPGQEAPVTVLGYSDHAMEPFVTRDGLRLYFTRWKLGSGPPAIWLARRASSDAAFARPQRLPIPGFVEAPALSPDEQLLYFHRKTGGRYALHVFALEDDQ